MNQRVFGSCSTINVAAQFRVSVREMDYKITAESNENCKANTLAINPKQFCHRGERERERERESERGQL